MSGFHLVKHYLKVKLGLLVGHQITHTLRIIQSQLLGTHLQQLQIHTKYQLKLLQVGLNLDKYQAWYKNIKEEIINGRKESRNIKHKP
jgi:hypothetical protein